MPRSAAPLALALALLLAALPATASASSGFSSDGADPYGSAPSDQSAGDQYVETLPTTRGPRAPRERKRVKKLRPDVAKKIDRLGGSDAAALEALATSSALGAPGAAATGADAGASDGKGSSRGSDKSRSRNGKRHGSSTPAVPSAAINAVDGGEAGLGWLVLAILAITALALGAVGYQRHRDKGTAD